MKRFSKILLLSLVAILLVGCGKDKIKEDVEEGYGVDLDSKHVLACTSLKYSLFGGVDSDIYEEQMLLVEFDDNDEDIKQVKEVYVADYSKSDKKFDDSTLDDTEKEFKTNYCDKRFRSIIPQSGYEGSQPTCDIKLDKEKKNVSVVITYPLEAVKYFVDKNYIGNLEELKNDSEGASNRWFYNTYFTCDKNYDKSKLIKKDVVRNVTIKVENATVEPSVAINILLLQVNTNQQYVDKMFEEYKVDTINRVRLESVSGDNDEGDYKLTYKCVAESEDKCNQVADALVDYLSEGRPNIKVTKK